VREGLDYSGVTEHEQAERRLFRLFTLLEAARATTRAAHRHTSSGSRFSDGQSLRHAAAAHAFAAETAFAIVDGAIDLCGRCADARGEVEYLDGSIFRPEKLLRSIRYHRVGRPADGNSGLLAAQNP
jgi:alkylation response protein AidB-like acyl-CoA dehydrogenase